MHPPRIFESAEALAPEWPVIRETLFHPPQNPSSGVEGFDGFVDVWMAGSLAEGL